MISGKIDQTDLNLAINYMVMERLTHCMGLDQYLFEEHDWLEIVFQRAAKGNLKEELLRLGQTNAAGLVTLFEKLHNIFGLDGEVLSGERQINLGVVVDPSKQHAVELSKMSMDSLNSYIEEGVKTYKNTCFEDVYSMFPWVNTVAAERLIDELLNQNIGTLDVGKVSKKRLDEETPEEYKSRVLKGIRFKWFNNPLGLNTLGLFIYLVEENIIKSQSDGTAISTLTIQELEDKLDKTFEKSFSNIKFTQKKTPIETDYIVAWKQNIYSLDSIVYSLLRKRDWLLFNYEEHGQNKGYAQHRILDKISGQLPYPLALMDGQSDLLTIIQTLWTTNCDSYGGYHFEFEFAELVEYSSIAEEIDHYKKDILPILEAKQSILASSSSANNSRLQGITAEINNIKAVYIPELEASQQLFDSDREQWLVYQKQLIECAKQLLSQTSTEDKKEQELITAKKKLLDAQQKTMEKMAKGEKAKPWIKVREPYYRYMKIK